MSARFAGRRRAGHQVAPAGGPCARDLRSRCGRRRISGRGILPLKVLITGAHGQVGRCLLASAPPDVSATGLTRAQLDVGDADAVKHALRAHGPAVIINAAAYTAVDRAETEVDAARRVNGLGPRHLARAAQASGARLVHISTDFVFDGRGSVPYAPNASTAPLGRMG